VKDSFDLRGELAVAVRNSAGAWRFVQRFAAAHARPLGASDGFGDEELRVAEVRLGLRLPEALGQVYRLIGKRDDLTRVQDYLLKPAEVCVDETGEVLVFRVENQNVAQWGIPLPALAEPDPPVVFRDQNPPAAEWEWQPFLDRVSWACVEMVLSEWMLAGGDFQDNRALDEETTGALENHFSRLPLPDYPMWALPNGRPTRWFHSEGTVLRDDAREWLWVRAPSAEELAATRRTLPGDWLGVGE
jgi:hypothetical protein